MHVDWQGAYTFSADVADVVARHLADPVRGQRWVALPPYRERGPEVPLEHYAQSVAVVYRKKSSRR